MSDDIWQNKEQTNLTEVDFINAQRLIDLFGRIVQAISKRDTVEGHFDLIIVESILEFAKNWVNIYKRLPSEEELENILAETVKDATQISFIEVTTEINDAEKEGRLTDNIVSEFGDLLDTDIPLNTSLALANTIHRYYLTKLSSYREELIAQLKKLLGKLTAK